MPRRRAYHEYSEPLDVIEFDELEPARPQKVQPRRQRPQNSDVPRKKKKRRFGFLKILFLMIIVSGLYFGYRYIQGGTGVWTIAVFGVDSRDGSLEKGALSDVEMLCVIDRKTGEIKLVSVFRDTYLEISPDGTYHKINEAYFKGGHEQAVEALERNLDLTIDDYATFNWKAVAEAITILGGIDLEISDSEFYYINAFITETVESTGLGSHHLEHAGMNHLDGVQAVAYARLRLMDTDYNRTARQRLVIQLAMDKAKEADFKTLSIVARTVFPQLSTSINLDDVIGMAKNIRKYHIGETGGFPFSRGETHIGKKDCVIPLTLESNVVQLHQILYGTEGYQPSSTVKQISAQIAADSGMGEVAENASEAKVAGQKGVEGGDSASGQAPGTDPAPVENQTSSASQEEGDIKEQEPVAEESDSSESAEESTEEQETSALETTGEKAESQTEQPKQMPDGPGQVESQPGADSKPGPGTSGGPGASSNSGDGQDSAFSGDKPVSESQEVGPGVP